MGSSRSWTLCTVLDPLAVASGFLSVQGMVLMLDPGVEVRHVDRLHAKCFILGGVEGCSVPPTSQVLGWAAR